MKDFPIFTTSNGVGSLTLREIPYSGCAYLRIQDGSDIHKFVQECIDFCHAAGAGHLYGSGHRDLENFPFHTDIVSLKILKSEIYQTDAMLFPITEKTLGQWKEIYNTRMRDIPNAAYMTDAGIQKIFQQGSGYFIHRDGQLLGIGIACDGQIDSVISVVPHCGQEIVSALASAMDTELISLEAASTNRAAMRLYDRMGFFKSKILASWYKIF